MGFVESPKNILLCGCGFLGKYLLTHIFEGYETFKENKDGNEKRSKKKIPNPPITYIIDKAHPDNLYKFPLLEIYDKKGYSEYLWQSWGDIMTLHKDQITRKVDDIVITTAIADVPYALKSPVDTYQTNVMNTLQFFEYLRVNDFEGKIIMMSSESVYGHQPYDKLPISEECLPNPANIYGTSKLAQEQIARTYAQSYGLNATIIRSATMYGPFGRTKQAIPIFVRQILDKKPVTLEGDGNQSRDFVYVEDTARAIELALYSKKKLRGETINIGSGRETSFLTLIRLILQTLDLDWDLSKSKDVKIDYKPFRAGEEGLRVVLDIAKAEKLLGYRQLVPLNGVDASGLKSEIEWVANWILNWDENEMDDLRRRLYPLRYLEKEEREKLKLKESGEADSIQVSV